MELLSSPPLNLPKTFDAVDVAIGSNADIADAVLSIGLDTYEIDPGSSDWQGAATPNDMDKVRSTIRQLYRDWSSEGAEERKASFQPMLEALDTIYADISLPQRCHLSVLVPGAGLGRLAFEVCKAGYSVEGNEISYHQLLVSNWILNHTRTAGGYDMHPWALSFSNHRTRANQLQKVAIPDVVPGQELDNASSDIGSELHAFQRMSMSSGDFCVLYKDEEYADAFDAVLTCFFVDTAPNVIAYIETIKHCLKPGGVWINLGPLLWHFETGGNSTSKKLDPNGAAGSSGMKSKYSNLGIGESGSFELTDDEVIQLVERFDFEIVRHEAQGLEAGYVRDTQSMIQNTYRPSFWVARK